MSGEQEDDLVDKACVYLLESRYPDGFNGNTKRIIRRKAATLVTRGGEVFYKKARKDSAGKMVLYNSCIVISNSILRYFKFSPLRLYRRSGIFAVLRRGSRS